MDFPQNSHDRKQRSSREMGREIAHKEKRKIQEGKLSKKDNSKPAAEWARQNYISPTRETGG